VRDEEGVAALAERVFAEWGRCDLIVNNAALAPPKPALEDSTKRWRLGLEVNVNGPFYFTYYFAPRMTAGEGRIVNILDWRALRPGADHFPYTVSKAALAALTQSLAVALAPRISVNGLALGAVLPPADRGASPDVIKNVPLGRWSEAAEVQQALVFLLAGPAYVTGEIVHVDGGRHLI